MGRNGVASQEGISQARIWPFRTATPVINNGKWCYSVALSEFAPAFLNGAQRSVNRKVQGSNPCPGANCKFEMRVLKLGAPCGVHPLYIHSSERYLRPTASCAREPAIVWPVAVQEPRFDSLLLPLRNPSTIGPRTDRDGCLPALLPSRSLEGTNHA